MPEPFGYTVDIAMDADAALRRLKRSRADVVLCDIRMPGHDGFWLIEQLQQKYPATAIIIATGLKDLDPRLTLRPGITGYLIKPFSLDDVQTAVQQAVAAVRALTPKSTLRLVEPPSSSES
jgi:CheY-like chemotaxis protein